MKATQTKRGKTSTNATRQSASNSTSIRLGGKPKPREIRPSEIHEYRMKTLQIQNQIKLQRTQLNRLKDKIAAKTEAINKTVSKSAEKPESSTIHETTINQVEKSIRGAENTLENLREEYERAQEDDRSATYQETEEELKVTYLEYDRLQGDIQSAKETAQDSEKQLREIDQRAGPEHASELKAMIAQNRSTNKQLREKWVAYQTKILKMKIDERIYNYKNPPKNKDSKEAEPQPNPGQYAKDEAEQIQKELERLQNKLERKDEHYRKHVDELLEIIDNQRRRIVDHLMGNDQQNEVE